MARKPKLSAAKLAREMARARIGAVPPTRRRLDKRRQAEKHKVNLARVEPPA